MAGTAPSDGFEAMSILVGAASSLRYGLESDTSQPGNELLPTRDRVFNAFEEHDQSGAAAPLVARSSVIHQCRVCQRTYERADHLTRHLRSHENSRPFRCQHCAKGFNRVDLLNRHVTAHERSSGRSRPAIKRTERAEKACNSCAAAKARCEESKPCRRCRTKGIACDTTYQHFNRKRPNSDANVAHHSFEVQAAGNPPEHTTRSQDVSNSLHSGRTEDDGIIDTFPGDIDSYTGPHVADNEAAHYINSPLSTDPLLPFRTAHEESPLRLDPNTQSSGLGRNQLHFQTLAEELLFFPSSAAFNNQTLDFGFDDFDFQDEQVEITAMAQKHNVIEQATIVEPTRELTNSGRDAARGQAAFARSPWLWTPAQKDHLLSDRDSLALDEEAMPPSLTPSSSPFTSSLPSCNSLSINAGLRDKMFYLVSAMTKYSTGVPSFPSLHLLNHIIDAYFHRQSNQIDTWIHTPTISMKDVHPEFLIALVCAGSTVISVPAIWKMGLALQDVVRVTVGDLVSSHVMDCSLGLIGITVGNGQ
jgi:Zinc finger, C2H2 type